MHGDDLFCKQGLADDDFEVNVNDIFFMDPTIDSFVRVRVWSMVLIFIRMYGTQPIYVSNK